MTTKMRLLATACFAVTACSEAPPPQGYTERLPETGDAAASAPVEQEPTPVGTNFVRVGDGVWRMCDGGRMVYFFTSYKTGAAIAVVLHQPECAK